MKSIAVALVVLLSTLPAIAEDGSGLTPNSEQRRLAMKHYEDGERLFREKRYDLARIEFEACFAITKNADLLHNLSRVAEQQGQIADAIVYEETFLEQKRAELSQVEIDQTEGRMVRLRAQLNVPQIPPPKKAESLPPPVAADRRRPPGPAIGLLAGGGAVLLIGIGCGAGAYVTARAFDQPVTIAEEATLMVRGQALDRAGIAFDVIGGAALAAGAIWAIADRVRRPAVSPTPSASRVGLGLAW